MLAQQACVGSVTGPAAAAACPLQHTMAILAPYWGTYSLRHALMPLIDCGRPLQIPQKGLLRRHMTAQSVEFLLTVMCVCTHAPAGQLSEGMLATFGPTGGLTPAALQVTQLLFLPCLSFVW